jgi:two-component system alkaline phosphatase synthesis response regulator PhoP
MISKHNQKVLVVDDEEDILELLKYNLKKEGYDVQIAIDGIKAVEIARSFHPDLVILDIMMPNHNYSILDPTICCLFVNTKSVYGK